MRAALVPSLAAALAAAVAGCGGTLVDHRGVGILGDAATCGEGQVICGGACTTQSASACGASCSPCGSAPADAVPVCSPSGPGGHDGSCDFACDAGLLRCGSGCCAPALVAAGGAFSCAATTTGEVHCFGAGDVGQLGDGATVDRATAARVGGFSSPVSALAAGDAHACALSGGATLCWGNGAAFGAAGSVLDPAPVASLAGATAIAAGATHTCGIVGGAVLCVGADPAAGGGSPALGGPALAVAAGFGFTCALVDAGGGNHAVKCWGADGFGQLGDGGSAGATAAPVTVAVPATMTSLSAGARHACAAAPTSDNQTLYCWGSNGSRQLGSDASGTGIFGPVRDTRVQKPVVAVAAGGHASCAVENDNGTLVPQCWSSDPLVSGGAALDGQPNLFPGAPASGPAFAFSAGAAHTCFVDAAGSPPRLRCFGTGARGRLGSGSVADSGSPVPVVDR